MGRQIRIFRQLNRNKIINHIFKSNALSYFNNDLYEELKEKYRFFCIRNLKNILITFQISEIKKNDIISILLKVFTFRTNYPLYKWKRFRKYRYFD